MRVLFAIFSVILIITLSCDNQEEHPDPADNLSDPVDSLSGLTEITDTTIYFIGEVFDETLNWVGTVPITDSLVTGYGETDPFYITPYSTEIVSGISYGPYCCNNIPEEINKRIAIHVIDSLGYDPDDLEDRERLKTLFEVGEKRIGWFGNPWFLPPEVVLVKGEHDLIPGEFEVEYIENIDDSLHYYSSKWDGQSIMENKLVILENETYYDCIDFGEVFCPRMHITFYIDCKLFDQNGEFATQITGKFRARFSIP